MAPRSEGRGHRRFTRVGRRAVLLLAAGAALVSCSPPAADSRGSGERVAVVTDLWSGTYADEARRLADQGYEVSVTSEMFELWSDEVTAAQQRSNPDIAVIIAGASIAPTPEAQAMAADTIATAAAGFTSARCVLVARVPPGASPWLGEDPSSLNTAIEAAVADDPRVHLIDLAPAGRPAAISSQKVAPAIAPADFATTLAGQLAICNGAAS